MAATYSLNAHRVDTCEQCAHRGKPRQFDEGDLYCQPPAQRHGHPIARLDDRRQEA